MTALFLDELWAHGVEVGHWCGIRDVVRRAGDARVETAKEVEGHLGRRDSMADTAQGIGHGLHALALVVDGEIPLPHGGELVQEDGMGLLVG